MGIDAMRPTNTMPRSRSEQWMGTEEQWMGLNPSPSGTFP